MLVCAVKHFPSSFASTWAALLLQEMVDNIPEGKKWECPECSAVRAERRKVALEKARQKRISQGVGLTR